MSLLALFTSKMSMIGTLQISPSALHLQEKQKHLSGEALSFLSVVFMTYSQCAMSGICGQYCPILANLSFILLTASLAK